MSPDKFDIKAKLREDYRGSTYRTRVDWTASFLNIPEDKCKKLLVEAGAVFDPRFPEWYDLQLIDQKPEKEMGVNKGPFLEPSVGRKIPRNIPPDVLDSWNG